MNSVEGRDDVARFSKGAGFMLIGKVGGRGLYLISQVILARLLGPKLFGLYALGWTVLRMGWIFAPLGIDTGVIKFGSRFWPTDTANLKGLVVRCLGLGVSSGVFFGCVLFFSAHWLGDVFQKEELVSIFQLFAFALPVVCVMRIASAASRITQRMEFSVYSEELGQPAVSIVLVVLFLMAGSGLNGAIYACNLSFAIASLLAIYFLIHLFKVPSFGSTVGTVSYKELLGYSLPTVLAASFSTFVIWIDRLFIGYYCESSQVGVYQAISQLAVLFAVILTAFNAVFTPMIVDLHSKGHMARLEDLFRVSTKWSIYVCFPLLLTILFAPQEVLGVLFGKNYSLDTAPLIILTASQFVNVSTGPVGMLLVMSGHQNQWLLVSAVTAASTIILSVFLIPRFELTGAAIAVALPFSGMFLAGLILVKTYLKIWPYDKRYIKGVAAAAIACLMLSLNRFFPLSSELSRLIVVALLAFFSFWIPLFAIGMDSEDSYIVDLIRCKLYGQGRNVYAK